MPNFGGNKDLGKSGKEYLNDLLCKFGPFCLQHSKTFWYITRLSTGNHHWVINAQTGPVFFGPPCRYSHWAFKHAPLLRIPLCVS